MWIKHSDDGYVNVNLIIVWQLEETSPNVWTIRGYYSVANGVTLAGTWATKAEAAEVLREMLRGTDPTTFGD